MKRLKKILKDSSKRETTRRSFLKSTLAVSAGSSALSLFPGLASFIFWIKGISIIGSNRAGIFLHLIPVFSTIMAILIFKEKFMFFHLVGAVLIISGIVLSSRGRHI